jgi:hypothetical protein
MCESQDLTLYTTLSDGVATLRPEQSFLTDYLRVARHPQVRGGMLAFVHEAIAPRRLDKSRGLRVGHTSSECSGTRVSAQRTGANPGHRTILPDV